MSKIALLGAGGKMGLRLSANLKGSGHEVRHVEISDGGKAALREKGFEPISQDRALSDAEVVILALPDNRIGSVLCGIEQQLAPGTMVMMLDVAAAYAGVLPEN